MKLSNHGNSAGIPVGYDGPKVIFNAARETLAVANVHDTFPWSTDRLEATRVKPQRFLDCRTHVRTTSDVVEVFQNRRSSVTVPTER